MINSNPLYHQIPNVMTPDTMGTIRCPSVIHRLRLLWHPRSLLYLLVNLAISFTNGIEQPNKTHSRFARLNFDGCRMMQRIGNLHLIGLISGQALEISFPRKFGEHGDMGEEIDAFLFLCSGLLHDFSGFLGGLRYLLHIDDPL